MESLLSVHSAISAQRAQLQLVEVQGDLLGGIELVESLLTHLYHQEDVYQDRYDTQVRVFGMLERNAERSCNYLNYCILVYYHKLSSYNSIIIGRGSKDHFKNSKSFYTQQQVYEEIDVIK
ncbi:hypothetical protein ABPG72_021918 [Tetrahymena utriculariae]